MKRIEFLRSRDFLEGFLITAHLREMTREPMMRIRAVRI
jgi:hypothetical protein